ncbi:PAS domain-containing protein [Profundibacterium mesophilum]|uniref:histidine kinase n=1 Tax=Profundibacterium mesophilum KAUST100406-0324 TaxID=1037889 RepID=A0A921NNJ5_9RHOB|nr:PAS domain-containing protein [Profundibacterium mesophilum]KAF0675021.1 two-component system cell cycle sensor histidine kinase and response regulator CckA [Profundibacterium mesophilum KAUST100406-0324]
MGFDIEAVFAAAPSPFVLLDAQLVITWANDEYCRVVHRAREEFVGRNIFDVFPAEEGSLSHQMLSASFRRVLESGLSDHLPLIPYAIQLDGKMTERFWSATHTPIPAADNSVAYILQHTSDVTDIHRGLAANEAKQNFDHAEMLRRAEEVSRRNLELDAATEFFQAVFNQAPSIISITTGPDHRISMANEAYRTAAGNRSLIGLSVREAFPDLEGQGYFELLDKVYETGIPEVRRRNPIDLVQPGGGEIERLYVDFVYQPLLDEAGETIGIFVQGHEVTEQVLSQMRLQEAEERFRGMAQTMPAHVWTATADGVIDWVSDQMTEYGGLGGESYAGAVRSIMHPDDIGRITSIWSRVIDDGSAYEAEFRLRRRDGVYRWFMARATPIRDETGSITRWIGTNIDIEDRQVAKSALADLNATLEARVEQRNQELEEVHATLRQGQKMEAIGNLAGGIAHDFNNLLQSITGSLQLAGRHMAQESPEYRRIALALSAVDRGAKLASQLLSFGRRQPLEPRAVHTGSLIGDIVAILSSAVGEGVDIRTTVAPDLWNIHADPTNVENALLNLAMNARDAMNGHGTLTIDLSNAVIERGGSAGGVDLAPGEYVRIAVTDTGTGMTSDVLEQVFEPFFTTKAAGRGTGLGLAMVYGFVKQSNGHVTIESKPGSGTTVILFLPRTSAETHTQSRSPEAPVVGGSETILLVEDDEAVRSTTGELLTELGYAVTEAQNADAAMALMEQGLRIDLLLTDAVMPGRLSSREMAEAARRLMPELAVLFSSGYACDVIVHDGRLDEGVNLLPKPYDRDTLARRVRDVIEETRQARETPQETGAAPQSVNGLRMLLCEDDALIRMDLEDMLGAAGIEVLSAGSGSEAVSILKGRSVDLLMTDIGLPDMTGIDLAGVALATSPDLPVLFATGHQSVPEAAGMARARVITKPFDDRMLIEAIERLLDIPQPSAMN